MTPRCLAGDAELFSAVAAALGDPARAGARLQLLADRPGPRRLLRVTLASGESFVVKHLVSGARRRLREALESALGLSAARREWRVLVRLRAAGVAVPEPRALGRLAGADLVLVTRQHPGRSLRDALPPDRERRRTLLARVAACLAELHAAGFVHGDLHQGSIRVTGDGPLLLDLRSARRSRAARTRARDLGALDHSLAPWLSACERLRLAVRALGLERPLGARARRRLAAVGRASAARGRARARSRTRRALRAGRHFASLATATPAGPARGLRCRDVPEAVVWAALAAEAGVTERDAQGGSPTHGATGALLKRDARSRVTRVESHGRRFVVKRWADRGVLRRALERLRGSPARRAWRGGHGLLARRVGVARPVAFLEPSLALFEDLSGWRPADRAVPDLAAPERVARTLFRLADALHRQGADHGDLKASHVRLAWVGGRLEARLLDLEDVRFPRRVSDASRVRALAQLNASLPDAIPAGARRDAFARLVRRLPFRRLAPDTALRRIVAASLARAHRWSGAGCGLAGAARASPRREPAGVPAPEPRARHFAETVTQRK